MKKNERNQISQRIENDAIEVDYSANNLIEMLSHKSLEYQGNIRTDDNLEAIDLVLKKITVLKPRTREFEDADEYIHYQTYTSNIMHRAVELTGKWYSNAFENMLGIRKEDGALVAFLMDPFGRYWYFDSHRRRKIKITSRNADQFSTEALLFYKALPPGEISITDMVKYCCRKLLTNFSPPLLCLTFVCILICLLIPVEVFLVFDVAIGSKTESMLITLGVLFFIFILILHSLKMVRRSYLDNFAMETSTEIEAAVYSRLLLLPNNFYKEHSAGELSDMVQYIASFSKNCVTIGHEGIGFLLALIGYMIEIDFIEPRLFGPTLLFLISICIFFLVVNIVTYRRAEERYEAQMKEKAVSYALLKGIEKIRYTGSEARMFSKWCDAYTKRNGTMYNPPGVLKFTEAITLLISFLGVGYLGFQLLDYGTNIEEGITYCTLMGLLITRLKSFFKTALSFTESLSTLEKAAPILQTAPESHSGQDLVTRLDGDIRLHGISCLDRESSLHIFDRLELHIAKGEYIGIVGANGSGKSELVRILLGMTRPAYGSILYDGKNIDNLNLRSLRQHIGTVLQSDDLIPGTIRENIVLANPWAEEEKIWEAIRMAGLEDHVKSLPLGLETVVLKESEGLTGTLKKKVLIARALATDPNVLILDEAMEALDGKTRSELNAKLRELKCTRILLSNDVNAVKDCDRICILSEGRISKSGTYDEVKGTKC